MQDYDLVRELQKIVNEEMGENCTITQDGMLDMKDRIYVPNVYDLIKVKIEEAHCFAYAIHPSSTNMYQTIKENYWWLGMKRDIAEFVSRCLVCQQVKAKHRILQPLPIPEWKWEHNTMNFVVSLPRT